ncbi:MAG: tetratricopeptide repeat protein [Verrucomicrobiota bacterium]|nr:tetratricopeptide repeat protein [Verrucomicrobiota bacterium]
MSFSPRKHHRWLIVCASAAIVWCEAGCHHPRSKQEQTLRAELSRAMREQAYDKAATLARNALESNPHDNGLWDRLVQAQFALGDLDGAKRVLATWRVAVEKPSP